MNNKKLGSDFEKELCQLLAEEGWWVHFISPNESGAQPFDIIAVKDGIALAGDCKTSVNNIFRINRLEENQKMAFDKWLACGNTMPYIFVKYKNWICAVPYAELKTKEKVNLEDWR